jgi:hypothetical protein
MYLQCLLPRPTSNHFPILIVHEGCGEECCYDYMWDILSGKCTNGPQS